jgi:hypothetical protein
MTINEIIFILENKVRNLEQQRSAAVNAGDINTVTAIDAQLIETVTTLDTLKKTQ